MTNFGTKKNAERKKKEREKKERKENASKENGSKENAASNTTSPAQVTQNATMRLGANDPC